WVITRLIGCNRTDPPPVKTRGMHEGFRNESGFVGAYGSREKAMPKMRTFDNAESIIIQSNPDRPMICAPELSFKTPTQIGSALRIARCKIRVAGGLHDLAPFFIS